jgi:hypothetical protein
MDAIAKLAVGPGVDLELDGFVIDLSASAAAVGGDHRRPPTAPATITGTQPASTPSDKPAQSGSTPARDS